MNYLKKLISKHRSQKLNENLGLILAFIAGYINAGGYFIVQQYTSHMTGILSISADEIALGHYTIGLIMLGFIFCFIFGASITTIAVIKARDNNLHSQFAFPLLLEAILLIVIVIFNLLYLGESFVIPATIASLCFLMGLQNALITKASTAIIRTTHITGMTTDLGIELGRAFLSREKSSKEFNKKKAWLHAIIITAFFVGGFIGAIATSNTKSIGLLPIAGLLILISTPALFRDYNFIKKYNKRINPN